MMFRLHVFVIVALCLISFNSRSQTVNQFNGTLNIQQVTLMGGNQYQLRGVFLDYSNFFNASQARVGDRIVDRAGSMFEITSLTAVGSEINAVTISLNKSNALLGEGMIFRPSPSGFPLITNNSSEGVKTSVINTATLSIDNRIAGFNSGTILPQLTVKNGDVILNLEDGNPYEFDGGSWNLIANVPSFFFFPEPTAKGDIMRHISQNKYYLSDGASWNPLNEGSSLPESAKFGDVFYVTTERKLYMMDDDGNWNNISSSSIPGGTDNDIPDDNEPGDLFFNTDKNILYVYDLTGKWSEISSDGSTPAGDSNPDSSLDIKLGKLFYNTSDNRLYVFNGSAWMPLDNSLTEGHIYIGDENNVAVPILMSGDATISKDAVLTIENKAVNNDKLDKSTIPLSGFGPAEASVSLGDGTNNFNITNLADPVTDQDAATKAYVDRIAETPSGATLPADPNVGDVFYNTTDKTLYVFDGTDWSAIRSGSNGGGGAIIDLPKDMFYIGDADNKAAPIDKIDIPLSGFGGAQDTLIMGNYRITMLGNPLYAEDAATKAYVDSKTTNAGNALPTAPKPGDTFFNTDDNRLYVYNGTEWVSLDNTLAEGQFYIGDVKNRAISIGKELISISGFGAATADISLGNGTTNYKITNLGTPTDDFDAVPKGYVDNILDGVTNGYMERALYDSNQDSIVDVAATVNGFTVESNVPDLAVFTDDLVKIGADGTPLYLSDDDFEINATGTEIVLKKLDFSKFDRIADNTLLGNNLGGDASPLALTAGEVKTILEMDKVDNTADEDKHVFSAGRIYPPIKINGEEFDGSSDIDLGDDLGNHTATENIKTGTYSISHDGESGKGLSFDVSGNAIYAQDLTVNGNFYTPSDQRLKTNIETLTEALENLDQLQGVRFEYIDQKKYMIGPKIGLIAQELQKVFPEMVSQGADGYLKVDYTQLSAVLIQAVKEQQQQLREQAKEIEDLKKRMDKQEDQLNHILQKLTE